MEEKDILEGGKKPDLHSKGIDKVVDKFFSGVGLFVKKKIGMLGVLLLIVLVIVGGYYLFFAESAIVDGDTVTVNYVGKLVSGEVFDTSIKEVGMASGLPKNSYTPLTFEVGEGQMIAGFDNALVGMKVGESKEVNIPAVDAYGLIDEVKLVNVPLEMEMDKILEVLNSELVQINSGDFEKGDEITVNNEVFEVIEKGEEKSKIELIIEVGGIMHLQGVPFGSEVVGIEDDKIIIKHLVKVGDLVSIQENLNVQQGLVIEVLDDNYTIDFNHPLAGKDLIFTINVLNVEKA